MFKRTLIALAVVAALLVGATAITFAGPTLTGAANPEVAAADVAQGQPQVTMERPLGYYIWYGDGRVHLLTHGPGSEHNFVARLHTDGIFKDVETVRLESRDKYAILDGGHTLVFDVHTYNWTDGVSFRVAGGSQLRFDLALNGQLISTDSIYLGVAGKHPRHNPFTIRRP